MHLLTPSRRRSLRRHVLPVLVAAAVLVGGADAVSYAATDHPLLVGRANTSGSLTVWSRSAPGPVLNLRPQPGSPPFTTTSETRVANLDADQVDGLDAPQLLSLAFHFEVPAIAGAEAALVDLPGLPPGVYQGSYAVVARTPGGTMNCGFTRTGAHGHLDGLAFGSRRYNWSTAEGSALLDTRQARVQLLCYVDPSSQHAGLSIDPDAGAGSAVTMTRIDTVRAAAASVSPSAKPASPTATRRSNRCLNSGTCER